MKIRSQIGMVLNLDKCIGCHTCSVVCKNIWTSREGVEYAWFNNVETKPGVGFPKNWEDQNTWNGGWTLNASGKLQLKAGNKIRLLANIFHNPNMPVIDSYYEPFNFNYGYLQSADSQNHQPVARPYSKITGQLMDKIHWGPNWEDDLGGKFSARRKDKNFEKIQHDMCGEFENTFMMYLPRLCEHCLNPACVASCPSGSIYKREKDGIVLIDQNKWRGWRRCVSGCPYKKIYFNWESGKSEKCILCYPRLEAGQPTACSESCVGRIRYLGVLLYDADKIAEIAASENPQDLYLRQKEIFLDPHDETVIAAALEAGIPQSTLDAAKKSPVYKLAVDWALALPLHPEYRTLPMVWYVPPLSPIQKALEKTESDEYFLSKIADLTIPLQYLANLLTAGDTKPVLTALERLMAMRIYNRAKRVNQETRLDILEKVGLTEVQLNEMYRYLAIANYEDRFVVPPAHTEDSDMLLEDEKGTCGFSFNNTCDGRGSVTLFGQQNGKRVHDGQLIFKDKL